MNRHLGISLLALAVGPLAPVLAQPVRTNLADAAFAPVVNPPPLPPGVGMFFGPEDKLADRIIGAINSATSEILVCQHVLTHSGIARTLVDAFKRRKVIVVVLLDPSPNLAGQYQTPEYFAINGVPVYAMQTGGGNAYIVIDRKVVLTGTFDFTESATRTDESLLAISESGIVVRFYNHFVNRLRASRRFEGPSTTAVR